MANTKLHPAEQYAQQVRNKEILTCELVQLAVQRYYRDLDNAFDKGWYFDRKAAIRAITFIERLKHTKGEWAGQRFRLEPWQQFIITTAGFNKNGACYAYRDNVVKVLRGVNTDDTLFGIIYTLDDQSEWDNPKMWIKSNPNLGVSLSADYLADQVTDAKNHPEAVRNVMTKNVNLWVDAEKTWILDETWMRCCGEMSVDDLAGCECWGGLDLSNISDITAYVLLFHERDRFQLLPFFWIPKEKMLEKIRKENINYDLWVQAGYVKVTEGNVIDH